MDHLVCSLRCAPGRSEMGCHAGRGPAPAADASPLPGLAPAVLFMLWAYTPEAVLEAHGVTYYPSKYWAVALPAWACVSVVFVYWLYER